MSWNEFVNGLAVYSDIIWDFSKPGFEYFFREILPAVFDSMVYFARYFGPVIINIISEIFYTLLSAL